MKKLFYLFFVLGLFAYNSYAQEFKLHYNNIDYLEKFEVSAELDRMRQKLEELAKNYETKIQKDAKVLKDKVALYDKQAKRQSDAENQKRLLEVQGMEQSIRSFQTKAKEDLSRKEREYFVNMFNRISKQENCTVVFDYEVVSKGYVYLDRNRGVLVINNSGKSIKNQNELTIRAYFDVVGAKEIEGIWRFQNQSLSKNHKLIILKEGFSFNAYVIGFDENYSPGSLIAQLEPTSNDGVFSIEWILEDEMERLNSIGIMKSNSLIEFVLNEKSFLYKMYPETNNSTISQNLPADIPKWKGNGSGIILSKSGYIVTNHHVVDGAKEIEVEFLLNEEVQKFNAEVIQKDPRNDLAIIKIADKNFDGLNELSYNFKTRSSDVGTKIYTFGYPKALSGMGKEMKVTEGIISSKSGLMGDITTYQITAPIQGGNSGGPLFDDKGNLIGINSSKFNSDETENVNYSIKSSYVLNLIDVLPESIDLPSSPKLQSLTLTEQIKEISKYVVLIKVK